VAAAGTRSAGGGPSPSSRSARRSAGIGMGGAFCSLGTVSMNFPGPRALRPHPHRCPVVDADGSECDQPWREVGLTPVKNAGRCWRYSPGLRPERAWRSCSRLRCSITSSSSSQEATSSARDEPTCVALLPPEPDREVHLYDSTVDGVRAVIPHAVGFGRQRNRRRRLSATLGHRHQKNTPGGGRTNARGLRRARMGHGCVDMRARAR
jgi:hypothetical protein